MLSAQGGAVSDNQEDELDLAVPAAYGYDLFPDYPANAAFDAVPGRDSTYPVRAEFWNGEIVALTAARGGDVQTVTTDQNPTDQNPADQGGTGLGVALLGLGFAELSVLLLFGVRAFRYRRPRPGLGLRLTVSALVVGCAGAIVAGACMTTQPARVLLTLTIAPSVTAGVILLTWLMVVGAWRRPGVRGLSRPRR